jgi:hypothetical protein
MLRPYTRISSLSASHVLSSYSAQIVERKTHEQFQLAHLKFGTCFEDWWDSCQALIHLFYHFPSVMSPFHMQYRKTQRLSEIHEFLVLAHFMLRSILRTDKLYVEVQNANFITSRESCLKTLFVTKRVSHNCSPYSAQLSGKSFVIIRISSLVKSHVSRQISILFCFR